MKIRNSTDWPEWFVRRMVAWCCKQIDLPMRAVKSARFGNKSEVAWGGRGGTYRIYVAVGPASAFPVEAFRYPGRTSDAFLGPRIADRLEALVAVTAHELTHVQEHQHLIRQPMIRRLRRGWNSERKTMFNERQVLEAFRANRDSLVAEWSAAPAAREKPKASVQDKRAAKAAADLARWQRKLKLAQTKCRKLKQRVNYYDKVLAANSPAH